MLRESAAMLPYLTWKKVTVCGRPQKPALAEGSLPCLSVASASPHPPPPPAGGRWDAAGRHSKQRGCDWLVWDKAEGLGTSIRTPWKPAVPPQLIGLRWFL